MASKSKSGLTKEDREQFLRVHGYIPVRSGKGSHEIWEHPELKILARTHKITAPPNLLPNPSQLPWETTLSSNPAGGTWAALSKLANWAQGTVETIKQSSLHEQQRCKIARDFRIAVADLRQWKKDLRHHLKANLPLDKAPEAPIAFQDFRQLEEKKKRLSQPSV